MENYLKLSRDDLDAMILCFYAGCEETNLSDIEQADLLRRIRLFKEGLPRNKLEWPTVVVEVRRRDRR